MSFIPTPHPPPSMVTIGFFIPSFVPLPFLFFKLMLISPDPHTIVSSDCFQYITGTRWRKRAKKILILSKHLNKDLFTLCSVLSHCPLTLVKAHWWRGMKFSQGNQEDICLWLYWEQNLSLYHCKRYQVKLQVAMPLLTRGKRDFGTTSWPPFL